MFGWIVITIGRVLYSVPLGSYLALLPIAFFAFLLSLLLGHYLAEPLHLLIQQVASFRTGENGELRTDGRMHEVDELAKAFNRLGKTARSQHHELVLKDKRQTEFVSDVAHELRTPLTAIRGNAEMLLDPDLPPELHDKFVDIIIGESDRLSRLTKDLLSLQRIENDTMPLELMRLDLGDIARDVLDMLDPILRERQANTEIRGEAPDVLGHPDRLRQMVLNLVENASRFIHPGGHITIELFGIRGNSVIAVKDDGPGFGDVDPKLLFDRFYRADSSRSRGTGGTGLGLAIVKSIVDGHDGTVDAFNLPDGGACFLVAIPSVNSDE
ncbi:MAG: HAMP domain-containing histidine kinase [Eggerthellaceae bacterium]|nr:HAMP domain-containing histidine kinase [Eggerthellaceae bacterium]